MRFASAPLVLGLLALACVSQASAPAQPPAGAARSEEKASEPRDESDHFAGVQENETAIAPRTVDLSHERQLVEEARAAVSAVDLVAAQSKIGEAIAALLARRNGEHEAGWLEVVDAAGRVAWDAQDLQAARTAWERVHEVRSRTLPDDHPDLQKARQNLAITIAALGDLADARALFEQVHEVRSRTLPDEHSDLQAARGNLALTIKPLGDLAGARALEEQVLEVFSRTLPDDHPDLQKARQNLAITIKSLGDLAGARGLEEQVLEVRSRTLPDDHPDLQTTRGNLALTIKALGDLAGARALEEQVLEVRSRTLPDDHPELQAARGNLAGTIAVLGDLAGARALEEQVLEVFSRTLPDDHPDLQKARQNLAITIKSLGDLAGARALEEQVLEVRSRMLPDDHPDLQWARGNLATTIHQLGDLAGARAFEEQVLEVRSRTLPDHHPDLQGARLNLASTMYALGDLVGARALFEQVLEVFSRTLPDDHPDLQMARLNLASTIAAERATVGGGEGERGKEEEGRPEKFTSLAGSFTRGIARSARLAVLTVSSREAEERCARFVQDLGRALSCAEGLGVFESEAGLEREAFVLSEETRGAALVSARLSRRAISDGRYGELRERMRLASDDLARLAQKGAGVEELDLARGRRETAERELASLARGLSGGGGGLLELDPSALSARLPKGEALVGYRRYTRWAYEPGGGTVPKSTESLCAFVLRSGDRLQRIELGPIEPIKSAVERWRESIGARLERGVGVTRVQRAESTLRGGELRRLVLDPLAGALEGVGRLVVAPDDVLHLVPLDALPLDGSSAGANKGAMRLVGERWRIETRCSLTELLWKEPPLSSGETLLALGGASFNLPPLPLTAEEGAALDEELANPAQGPSILRGSIWERGFEPLTHSGPEARGIAALYGEIFEGRRPSLVLEERKASRAALSELAPKARFLHVATHGWFAPESVRSIADPEPLDAKLGFGARMSTEERVRGLSPMLLCGLALAGANLKEDEVGRLPGLVTAEELSTFDLSGCELAVLSACDTNVGERRAGQGVASLQKALHMAGARSVITSLWEVPDVATRKLMLDFYRRIWVEKKPKAQALWEAKMKLCDAKDAQGRLLYTTRDWAAWVLTGDPE